MTRRNLPPKWIWIKEASCQRDKKICFRKKIRSVYRIRELELNIWADSRYYLWVNGDFTGTGPSRCWPEFPQKDTYRIDLQNPDSEVQLAILVWHYGTSTSQYIHGPAGLIVAGKYIDEKGSIETFGTDTDWRCTEHRGYLRPVPRINVSQPWIEMLDSAVFPENWMQPDFDDALWRTAVICKIRSFRNGKFNRFEFMANRDIPRLSSVIRQPEKIVQQHFTLCRGTGIRIDYKETFYPSDTTTEDRLQTGYICCVIESSVRQPLIFTLADRIWPEADEYLILNGQKHVIPEGCKDIELILEKGKNLFMLDVSGARQRFTSDIHFKTEHHIAFLKPLPGSGAFFAALGPFETAAIGNIVCADGFGIDGDNGDFLRAGRCKTVEDLREFKKEIRPVENTLFDGVKLRNTGAAEKTTQSRPIPMPEKLFMKASNENGDHEIIIDMGIEVSGFLSFSVESSEYAEIDFRFFEYLSGGIPEIPDDLDTSLRYVCSKGKVEFRSLLRRGFRYIALRTRAASDIMLSGLHVDEQLFPLKKRGSFKTEDRVLESVWRMCRKTVELCSEDTLADSPAFEQAFWTGDAYVMAQYHQYLFGETGLTRHCLLLAARSMNYSELPDSHLPAGVHLILTAWAQLWILAARDYFIHTADTGFLEELYPWLEKAARAFMDHIDERGLLKIDAWNMLDWAPMDTPYKGTVTHLNARLAACFKAVSELAGILNLSSDELTWKFYAEQVAKKADEVFWDETRLCYIDSIHDNGTRSEVISVQTNLMMMIYDCVPPERKEKIKSFILTPPANAVKPGSPFLAHFYYNYLFSIGLGERALKGIRDQWSPMLEQGTCWETFKGFYKDRLTRSYCHAWSSAPAYLFGAWVLGIRPLKPGFRKIIIAPVTSGLKYAEGTVPIPSGDVHIRWSIENKELKCDVRLPAGVEWDFNPPAGNWTTFKIDVEDYIYPEAE